MPGTQIGSAFIDVTADTTQAEGNLGRFAAGAGVALAAVGAAAVVGLGAVAKSSVDMNAFLETSELQFQTLLGDAEAAEAHVASLFEFAAKTPFETGPIIEASKTLQIFGGEALNNEEILTRVGNASAALGQPIGEVANQVGKMFSALQGGGSIGETTEQLLRMGVITPEVKNQLIEMQKAGASADEVFAVMTAQLDTFGGAMELQANSWAGLTSSIKDNLGILGADAFAPLFEFLKKMAAAFLEFLSSDEAAAWAERISNALSTVFDWLNKVFDAFQTAREGGASFGEAIMTAIGGIGNLDLGSLFSGLLEAAQKAFFSLVDWLTGGGMEMILSGILAGRERLFDAALQLFPVLIDALLTVIPQLLDTITGKVIPQLVAFIVSAVPKILDAAVTLFSQIVQALVVILPDLIGTLLGDVLPTLLTTIVGMVPDILAAAIELFTTLIDAVLTLLPELLGVLLGDVLPNLISTILSMLPTILQAAIDLFMALITAVVTVLPQLLTTLLTVVLPNLLGTILGMIPQLLTTAIELFLQLVLAVVKVLPQLLTTLIRDVLPAVLAQLIKMIPLLLSTAIEVFMALVDAIIKVVPTLVKTIAVDLIPGIVGAILGMGPMLFNAGKEALNQLWDGIKEVAAKVVKWVQDNVVKKIANLWPFSPAKEGPFAGSGSPLHAGRNIMGLLAEGLREGTKDVLRAAELATGGISLGGPIPVAVGAGGGRGGSMINATFNFTLNGGATPSDALMVSNEVETALRRLAAESKVH